MAEEATEKPAPKQRAPRRARGSQEKDAVSGRIYAHIDIDGLGMEGFSVSQTDPGSIISDDERTWSFEAPVEVGQRLVETQEFVATHPSGVPLTADEQRAAADLDQRARVESSNLSQALAELARERITKGE